MENEKTTKAKKKTAGSCPSTMTGPLWKYIEKHPDHTIGDMAQHIEKLENLICKAAPLAMMEDNEPTESGNSAEVRIQSTNLLSILSELSKTIQFIFDNETSFMMRFAKGKWDDLLEITFGSKHIRIAYLVRSGATVTDSIEIDEFLIWCR